MSVSLLAAAAESSLGGSAPAGAMGGGLDDAQSRLTEGGGRWCDLIL